MERLTHEADFGLEDWEESEWLIVCRANTEKVHLFRAIG